jgi:hypothetical protein
MLRSNGDFRYAPDGLHRSAHNLKVSGGRAGAPATKALVGKDFYSFPTRLRALTGSQQEPDEINTFHVPIEKLRGTTTS